MDLDTSLRAHPIAVKNVVVAVVAAILAALVIIVAVRAPAQEPPPPSKMSHEKVLELQNAMLQIQLISTQAHNEAAPYITKRDAICAEFKINPTDIGKGTGIADDGTITRPGAPPAPSSVPPALAPPTPAHAK